MKLILFTWILLFLPFFAQSAVVMKLHNNQALIHLEGLKTKKGSYFEALDLYGNSKGLVQIKRVGNKKAIGSLKLGKIGLKWSLEPKSKAWAISKLRKYKTAILQKQKLKRKRLAQYRMKKRRLSQRKRKAQREVASYDEGEEFLTDDSQFTFNDSSDYSSNDSYDSDSKELSKPSDSVNITVGIQPSGNFNFMKISPPKINDIIMTGFGFGGKFFVETSLNKYLSTGGYVGYQRYSTASKDKCGRSKRCGLDIDYVTAGLNLKSYFLNKKPIKLFFEINGSMLYPLIYDNRANLSQNSFGFHGTLGVALGADLSFGNFVVPISIDSNLIIPPTATTLIGITSLSLGVAYKF